MNQTGAASPADQTRRTFLAQAGKIVGAAATTLALLPLQHGRAIAADARGAAMLNVPNPTLAEIGKSRGIVAAAPLPAEMPPVAPASPALDAAGLICVREFDALVVSCKNDEIMRPNGSIDWSRPEAVIDYLRPTGHPVIWHTLFWSLASTYVAHITDRQLGIATLKRWIQDFLTHWGTLPVHSVQVVNELHFPWSKQHWGYNTNGLNGGPHPWIAAIGEDAPELAFRFAAEVVQRGTKLVLNEMPFAILGGNWGAYRRQRRLILATLRRWRDRHVPIDALGIQLHLAPGFQTVGSPPPLTHLDYVDIEATLRFMDEVAELGLEIHLTEFDCTDLYLSGMSRDERRAESAAFSQKVLTPLIGHKAVRLFGTCGVTDNPVSNYLTDARWDKPDPRWADKPTVPPPREAMLYDAASNPRPKPLRTTVASALIHAAPR